MMGKSQIQLYREAERQIADGNSLFLEMVREGMTREDLRRLIARRPERWSRFSGWIYKLPETPKGIHT